MCDHRAHIGPQNGSVHLDCSDRDFFCSIRCYSRVSSAQVWKTAPGECIELGLRFLTVRTVEIPTVNKIGEVGVLKCWERSMWLHIRHGLYQQHTKRQKMSLSRRLLNLIKMAPSFRLVPTSECWLSLFTSIFLMITHEALALYYIVQWHLTTSDYYYIVRLIKIS